MKAASISYRVADFLRRHPPFEWMDEADLVALAKTGRVRFHEAHEVLHDAGEARREHFTVIQQGTVEILDADEGLRDLLGPGDIVGIGSSERHRFCARTASDVLVYAFPQEALRPLLERHPRAAHYLDVVFALAAEDRTGGISSLGPSRSWLDEVLPASSASCEASRCLEDEPIRDVARRMTEQGLSAVAVVGADGRPKGIVRDSDLRAHVATGERTADDEIGSLLPFVSDAFSQLEQGRSAGEYWKSMLRAQASAVAILGPRGDPNEVLGVLTENDLAVRSAQDPLAPILRIRRARDLAQVGAFHRDAEAAIEHLLAERSSARWALEAAGALDAATCRRVIELAESELAGAAAETERSWLLMGASGRRERFGPMPLGLGLTWTGEASAADGIRRLADRVGASLRAAGLRLAPHALPGRPDIPTHGTVDEWKRAYEGWVHDPIGAGMYQALAFFDLLPIAGSTELANELVRWVQRAIASDDSFLPLLAGDSMAHLPPLTFFRGQVVDKEGERTELLHLENCAVRPLTDIARVFGLRTADVGGCETAGRLRLAARELPGNEALFRRAAEAAELALLQRARAAYGSSEDRPEVRPESLLKVDRELLKSCFRTILELLEMTARHFGFPGPR